MRNLLRNLRVRDANNSGAAGEAAIAGAVTAMRETQVASMAAGLVTRIALHPFDTCKTRLQHIRSPHPARAVLKFIEIEKLGGLYRGIAGALVGVLPYSLFYMPSYEWGQRKLDLMLGQRQLWGARNIAAGAFAGLCGSAIKTPVDIVKKRVQAGLYKNALVALAALVSEAQGSRPFQRLAPFYCGWRSSVMYDIPYNAVQFSILEVVKRLQHWHIDKTSNGSTSGSAGHTVRLVSSPRRNVITGAITGALTSLLTEPLDVVKTRIMTQQRHSFGKSGVTYYKNWVHGLRTIVREEGLQALWKGSIPRLVWVAGSGAIWYGTYATVRQHMQQRKRLVANERDSPSTRCRGSVALSKSPQKFFDFCGRQ